MCCFRANACNLIVSWYDAVGGWLVLVGCKRVAYTQKAPQRVRLRGCGGITVSISVRHVAAVYTNGGS